MELFLFWLVFSIAVGVIASSRGRSWWAWFGLSIVISPLLACILVLAMPSAHALRPDPEAPTPETHVRCPDCRELVRHDARKCRHCGTPLVPQ